VIRAREVQQQRYAELPGVYANAQLPSNKVHEWCAIDAAGQTLLRAAMQKLSLSARAYDRILKVSRTVADLAGSEHIKVEHLAEAIHYRSLDRENWGN
jgi:magnesium chelatase family protein